MGTAGRLPLLVSPPMAYVIALIISSVNFVNPRFLRHRSSGFTLRYNAPDLTGVIRWNVKIKEECNV